MLSGHMGVSMSEEVTAKFREEFSAAIERDKGKLRTWPPLPRRVRLRLWLGHKVNAAGSGS